SLIDQTWLTVTPGAISVSSAGSSAFSASLASQPLMVLQPLAETVRARASTRVRMRMRSGLRLAGQLAAGFGELHFQQRADRRCLVEIGQGLGVGLAGLLAPAQGQLGIATQLGHRGGVAAAGLQRGQS